MWTTAGAMATLTCPSSTLHNLVLGTVINRQRTKGQKLRDGKQTSMTTAWMADLKRLSLGPLFLPSAASVHLLDEEVEAAKSFVVPLEAPTT